MLQEPFAFGNSWMHLLDPRTRLAVAFFYSAVIAVSRSFAVLYVALLISVILLIMVRLPARQVIQRVLVVNAFIFFLWLILPVTFQGIPVYTVGPLRIYGPGMAMALQITLKSNAILLALISMVATMTLPTIGWALSSLHVPDKAVHLLLMTYRYVYLIDEEFQKILRAARIRGFQPGTNLHTYKTYAYLIGMLLVRCTLRADRVYKAMLCRGFKRKFYCLSEYRAGKTEVFFASGMGFVTLAMVLMEVLRFE